MYSTRNGGKEVGRLMAECLGGWERWRLKGKHRGGARIWANCNSDDWVVVVVRVEDGVILCNYCTATNAPGR